MDNRTPEQRHTNMSHIKSKNTQPELTLMKALRNDGIWFTHHRKDVYGKPDIVFKRKKVAVFVDSEFWHGKKPLPKSNIEFWEKRFARNRNRDEQVNAELTKQGWIVIRISDVDIKKNLCDCVEKIKTVINN